MKILDCKFYNHRWKKEIINLLLPRGYLGITAFRHILQDSRTQNIPLILETPNFGQPNEVQGKEIGILQTLSGNLDTNKSEEDLQEEIRCVVKEAKSRP
jgi:AP endonuclease-1